MLHNNIYMLRHLLISAISLGVLFHTCTANAANELGGDHATSCQIIDEALKFHFAQDEGTGICGIDNASKNKLCIHRPNTSIYITNETVNLKAPFDAKASLNLVPVLKLSKTEKAKIKESFQSVSTQFQILTTMKLWGSFEKSTKSTTGQSPNISPARGHDMALGYMERRIKRWSNKLGPTDPKVIDLKKSLDERKKDWAFQSSKSDANLNHEVSTIQQSIYDKLESIMAASHNITTAIRLAEDARESYKWAMTDMPLDCSGKITPHKNMYFNLGNALVNSVTAEPIHELSMANHWHPKSFGPRSLAFFDNGKYAIFTYHGHNGGHSFQIGKPPRVLLLERHKTSWSVIAASANAPIFY